MFSQGYSNCGVNQYSMSLLYLDCSTRQEHSFCQFKHSQTAAVPVAIRAEIWFLHDTRNLFDQALQMWWNKQNKDHQKIRVDPMFIIVYNSRSILTAVTPTAVAPTVVIL